MKRKLEQLNTAATEIPSNTHGEIVPSIIMSILWEVNHSSAKTQRQDYNRLQGYLKQSFMG